MPPTSPGTSSAAAPRAATTPAAAASKPAESHAVARPELSTWRARTFGNGPGRATFVPELTQRIASVKTHLRTLRDLAATQETADAATRQKQVDDTYVALSDDLEQLNTQFSLLFGSPSAVSDMDGVPPDWARRASSALPHAEALERLVDELLTHDDLPSVKRGRQARHPVTITFAALWNVIAADAPSAPR
jgi:hypothetical protein